MFPVHVVQRQGNDFTPSQPVDRQEQQNGAIPDIVGIVRIGAANESLHVFPPGPGRKRLVAEQTRSFDTAGQVLRAPRLLTGVAKETSQRAGKAGQRYPGPALQSSQRKKSVDLFESHLADAASLLAEPAQKRLNVPASIVDRV